MDELVLCLRFPIPFSFIFIVKYANFGLCAVGISVFVFPRAFAQLPFLLLLLVIKYLWILRRSFSAFYLNFSLNWLVQLCASAINVEIGKKKVEERIEKKAYKVDTLWNVKNALLIQMKIQWGCFWYIYVCKTRGKVKILTCSLNAQTQ